MSLKSILIILGITIGVGLTFVFAPLALRMAETWALRPKPAEPLTIPSIGSANSIGIRQRRGDKRVITDQQVIKQLSAFLLQINNQWRTVPDTFPVGEYTISLKNNNSGILTLWLGNKWIGTQSGTSRTRSLSPAEEHELKTILGI